mmetsp:Transcript_24223/g.68681  ORF Transcript_24223/g.68681 Transcript_24223/m.68681 type:complete len:571 (+) Transcript_24223:113-1825(+)
MPKANSSAADLNSSVRHGNSSNGPVKDHKVLDRQLQVLQDQAGMNRQNTMSDGRRLSAEQMSALQNGGFQNEHMFTEFKTPEWFEMILAVTGIAMLQQRIKEEMDERAKDTFQNPYQELFVIVSSIRFEVGIAIAILSNCLFIGMEASWPDDDAAIVFNSLEHIFVGFFLIEWCLRMRAFGWVWFFDTPNTADTFLVFGTGVIPKWILEPSGLDLGTLRILTVLRALRLVRIVRVVRLLPQFKELWMLIQGLVQSVRPLLWTSVIALMILYIFGIAATEFIGRQEVFQDDEYVQELFGNPMRSMFTLFQMMTLDAWGNSIARPVMEKDWWLCLFFAFFIMIAVFVFWNLITAVIVQNALSIANEDTQLKAKDLEAKKKQDLKVLADMFLEIDTDGSGELSTGEFFAALDNPKVRQMLELIGVKVEEMHEVWRVLDDGDGFLTVKEFSSGLRRMKGNAKAKDIIDIIKKLRHTALHHTELQSQVQQFSASLGSLEHDVERIQQDTGEVLGLFQEMYHRLTAQIEKEKGEDRLYALQLAKKVEADGVDGADEAENSEDSDDERPWHPPTTTT